MFSRLMDEVGPVSPTMSDGSPLPDEDSYVDAPCLARARTDPDVLTKPIGDELEVAVHGLCRRSTDRGEGS